MTTAYSYIRFSHPNQAEGDSLRRQIELAADYCRRHGLTLDTSLSLRDLGVSAFKGANAAVGNFRTFLDAIKTGRVVSGSVLIVESFDRISRQGIDEGYDLIKNILKAGIRIVTLSPERSFDRDATKSLSKGALEIQLILERAAEESERKSERVGRAWAQKKQNADSQIVSKKVPGWIRVVDGKLKLDPEGAGTVLKIFTLARDGFGCVAIAKQLNIEDVPVLGRQEFKGKPVKWGDSLIRHILTARTTIGEYQPRVGRNAERKAIGEPVKGYYPPVVNENLFYAVQGLMKTRRSGDRSGWRGRTGKHINLFSGMLVDAHDGGALTYRSESKCQPRTIFPSGAARGTGSRWSSFPADQFESAILSRLREVKVSDVIGDSSAVSEAESLAGQIAQVDELIEAWKGKMDNLTILDTVAAKLEELSTRRRDLTDKLADAQREAASPASESWGEFQSLAEMLSKDDSEEIRTKARAALRRSIESVHCAFARFRSVNLAAVRVQFRGSEAHRDYLIRYKPGGNNGRRKRDAKLVIDSFPAKGGGLDLRKPKDAAAVIAWLEELTDDQVDQLLE